MYLAFILLLNFVASHTCTFLSLFSPSRPSRREGHPPHSYLLNRNAYCVAVLLQSKGCTWQVPPPEGFREALTPPQYFHSQNPPLLTLSPLNPNYYSSTSHSLSSLPSHSKTFVFLSIRYSLTEKHSAHYLNQ